MIQIDIAPQTLVRGRPTEVVVAVTNSSPTDIVYSVVVEVELDSALRLDHGACRIEIDQLTPGAVDDCNRLTLTARMAGIGLVDFPYVTYRTGNGRSVRPECPSVQFSIDAGLESDELPHTSPPAPGLEGIVPSAFISHRRDDSYAFASLLREKLRHRLPSSQIFVDFAGIGPGEPWRAALDRRLDRANALLALIGPTWESIADETGCPRLRSPDDVVRYEVATALQRKIFVIPILHDRTTLPLARDLPYDLRALRDFQSIHLDLHMLRHVIQEIAVSLRRVGLR